MGLAIKAYLLHCRDDELAENTIKNYQNTLSQLDHWLAGRQVTKTLLIEYKFYLKEQKHYKLTTLNQKLTAINIYLHWSDQAELTLKQFKTQSVTHREALNHKEYHRLLRYSMGELRLLILTIGNTGLRISEVCSLRKTDLSGKFLAINNKGKTRTVAIPAFIKKQLKHFMVGKSNDSLIFDKSQAWYRYELKQLAEPVRVKREKLYPHSLRHYFAKQFIKDGGDSTALQQMLGHASISTTTIYTHMDADELSVQFRQIHNV